MPSLGRVVLGDLDEQHGKSLTESSQERRTHTALVCKRVPSQEQYCTNINITWPQPLPCAPLRILGRRHGYRTGETRRRRHALLHYLLQSHAFLPQEAANFRLRNQKSAERDYR